MRTKKNLVKGKRGSGTKTQKEKIIRVRKARETQVLAADKKLTAFERETIILFNEGSDTATIFTYNRKWQNHLEKKLGLIPMENGYGGKEYEIKKALIKLPRAKKNVSPKMLQALKRARKKANGESR